MRKQMKRIVLMMLAMLPIAAVAFAAKSALSVAHIAQGGASDSLLAGGSSESHATG